MRRSLQSLLVSLGCLVLAAYFGHHTVSGRYGLETQQKLRDRHGMIASRIAALESARRRLRRDVAALAQDPPNSDYVEEIAQSALGYSYVGDRIVVSRSQAYSQPRSRVGTTSGKAAR